MSIGKSLYSQGSIAGSLNETLRAPRRSGRSYDYLAGAKDEQRNVDPKKFDYHDATSANTRSKSYDYMDADQNRETAPRQSTLDVIPHPPQQQQQQQPHRRRTDKSFGDEALNSSCGSDLVQQHSTTTTGASVGGRIAGGRYGNRYESAKGRGSDSDSEAEDDMWLTEQLAKQLPSIFNPPDEQPVQAKTANAGPIGLLGFGMTTIVLNLHNTGHYSLYSVIPAAGICFGGGAQFIAGLLEWTRGNTFGYVAFSSYGAFWCSLVCVWMLPNTSMGVPNGVVASSGYFVGVYLIIWGIFSFFMMCCTIRMNLGIFLVFFTVTLLFFLLGGANMAGNATAVKAAGYEGIVCGSIALYVGFAEVVNEVWDRTILPIFPFTQLLGWFERCCPAKEEEKEEARGNAAAVMV